jgi:TP901 family phage tail tape measure protein
LANDENLSANIDVSVGIDSASIKKAKDDIASLGTAVDLVAEKLGSIGKGKRPASFKEIENSLEAAFTNAFERAAKAGYKFSIDARTGSPSLSPVGERGYAAEQKRVRANKFGGDKYLPIDQLSMSGPDAAAIRKGIISSLKKMGFTGINDFIVGGLTVAEDELKKLSLTDVFDGSVSATLKEDLGSWGELLQDEMRKAQAEWLNSEAKKMSAIIGKTFMSDAMANSGQSSDFQINDQVLSVLQYGGKLPKKINGGTEDIKLALQDFIAGPGGTPIISPQTFLAAVQDAMKNIPNAVGGMSSRAGIAEAEKIALQKEIEKELGATFDEISQAINQAVEDYDYSKDDKNAARRQKRREEAAAKAAEEQKRAMGVMLVSTSRTPGGGISPFSTDTGFYQPDKKDQLFQQIKQQMGAGISNDQFEPMFNEVLDDYITKIFKSIAEQANAAGEKVISNQMSNYGELQIGDPTGALDNMQEYVDRAIIGKVAQLEQKYGLTQGSFATRGRSILPNDYHSIVNTAMQTNLPGLPQSRPTLMPGAGTSLWADSEVPLAALRAILAEMKAQQKEIEQQTKTIVNNNTVTAKPAAASEEVGQAVVENVTNSAVEALRGAYNSPEFQKLKNLIGAELFDKIFVFVGESLKQNAGNFTAAWDTEFAQQLKGKANTILESSLVLKNALGQFLDLQTFMHRPAYLAEGGLGVAGMNQGMYVQGAGADSSITSVADFNKRAKMLGIPESELGDLKNAEQNKAELDKKITALLGLINLLDQLRIPLSGSNIMGADFKQLQNTVDFMATQGSHARLTGGLTNVVDNVGIIRSMQGSANVTDPGVMFANANKGGLGQGKLLEKLFTDFKEATAPYADMVKFGEKGFTIKINGQELPAHTAQADAIASIIVTEVMRQVSPRFRNLMDDPGYNWLATNSVYSAETMPYASPSKTKTKGKPATFDTQQRSLEAQVLVEQTRTADQQASPAGQAAIADAKLTHVLALYKAIQSVISGTATDATKADADIRKMVDALGAQTEARVAVLSKQSVRTEQETEELARGNRFLALRADLLSDSKTTTATLYKINRELVDDYTKGLAKVQAEEAARSKEAKTLDKMHATLSTMLSQPKLPVAISTVGYSGSQASTMPIGKTEMANPFNQQAGSVFGKQIQAQMKEYVAAEKRVESANKNMINTWVTARYALYDVGNAFQNVSNRLFMTARQIFNLTDAYRSFETAFMPVERAMELLSDETEGMLDQFIKLSQTIPSTVEELSRIATLGAQMGIGASGITKFTETVSQFASITGMSVDTIAEKFGRIAQLTKLDPDQMSNLGSAIAYAGVNAVATEPQIISLAEGIAAVSERVGVLPAEVIGLSTSLASLGVPAEQARGVFTRLFGKIDRAVGQGGPTLAKFAKIAGVSADEFKSKWGEAGQSYEIFRGILNGVNTSGKNLTEVFDTLGIVESREINTLTRLAKNLDVVDSSMRDATKAFASNIFLQQAFGKSSETVDAKIKLFQNSVQSFGAEIGKNLSGSFKTVLESLTGLMNGLKALAGNEFMQAIASASTAVVAFGGVGAGIIATMAKITAQIYAFRVAMINTANDPTAVAGYGKQLRALLNYKTELIEMRDGLQSPNANARGQIQPIAYGLTTSKESRADYLQKESNIYRASGTEIRKQLDQLAVAEGTRDKVRKDSQVTSAQQLVYARMEADSINQIVRARNFEIEALDLEISKKVQAGTMSSQDASATMAEARARQIHVVAINGEIKALTQEEILNAKGYSSSGVITKQKYQEAAARMANSKAIDIETKAGAVGTGGILGGIGSKIMGIAGWAGIALTVATAVAGITTAFVEAEKAARTFDLVESGGGLASFRDAIYKDTAEFEKSKQAIGLVKVKYDEYSATLTKTATAVQEATGTTIEMNTQTADLTKEVKYQTLALGKNAKAWIANSIASNPKVQTIFDENPNFLSDLRQQGIDFNKIVEDMMNPKVKNPLKDINALVKESVTDFEMWNAAKVYEKAGGNDWWSKLLPPGKTVKETEKAARNRMETLKKIQGIFEGIGTAVKSATNQSVFQDILNDILGTGDGGGGGGDDDPLAKSIKTTRDWASEMAGIFSEAFQNRYGKMQALDNINKQFMDMKKEVEDAKKAIDDIRISIQELTADRGTLQAQLDVAVRYGDTVRADQLRAELAQKDKEIADANSQIAQQQATLNKTLVGNSMEAIANRAQVLALVQSYAPYIEEILATTKNSTLAKKKIATLKQQATDRLLSLGFSASEITEGEFTKHFDDMLTIVTNKPRDITLKLVEDPALDAIRSFVAKANGNLSKIKSAITIDVTTKGAKNGQPYATGGFVSGPGTGTSDSIPAMLSNGEYVLRAAAVKKIGLDNLNKLNKADAMKFANGGMVKKYKDGGYIPRESGLPTNEHLPADTANFKRWRGWMVARPGAGINDYGDEIFGHTRNEKTGKYTFNSAMDAYRYYEILIKNRRKLVPYIDKEYQKHLKEWRSPEQANNYRISNLVANKTYPPFNGLTQTEAKTFQKSINRVYGKDSLKKIWTQLKLDSKLLGGPMKLTANQQMLYNAFAGEVTPTLPNNAPRFSYYANGGFIKGAGTSRSDSIPAMLSNGEYVINAGSVAKYGLDFMNSLNQQRVGYTQGPAQIANNPSNDNQMVYLSPEDRALLRSAIDRPVNLYTENTKIAQSANAGNVLLAQRGKN